MKIVAYLRVSTDKQAEEGFGLDVQRAHCRTWAKANGHRIVSWRIDEGLSGSNGLETRVGLYDAMGDLRDGAADALLVPKLDRLARDLIVQEQLLAEVRRLGREAFSASAAEASYVTDDPEDPSRKLIRQIIGAVNEWERSTIVLRMRRGRKMKASQGKFAYGSPRFGTKAVERELAANDDEIAVIGVMREMRDSGLSYGKIAERLNEQGKLPKRGGKWYAQTVSRVLNRP